MTVQAARCCCCCRCCLLFHFGKRVAGKSATWLENAAANVITPREHVNSKRFAAHSTTSQRRSSRPAYLRSVLFQLCRDPSGRPTSTVRNLEISIAPLGPDARDEKFFDTVFLLFFSFFLFSVGFGIF